MLKRVWAVVQKELTQMLRDRSTLTLLLVVPVVQLVLFGFAINLNVDHIPLVVADQSMDAASTAYIAALESSSYFDVVRSVANADEVTAALDAGEARAGLVIPTGFAGQVERGAQSGPPAQVLFLFDGTDLFVAQTGYSMAGIIAEQHGAELLMERVRSAGLAFEAVQPLEARFRILYNPDLAQMRFIIPGMVAMLLQMQAVSLTASSIVREREIGTMEQLLVTPIRPFELMLGKIIPNLVVAFVNMLTVVALAVYGFKVPFQGSFLAFCLLSVVFVFSGLGMGLLVSTVSRNLKQANQLVMAVMMIGLVLAGFLFPRYTMPPLLQWLGYVFPLTFFIPIARGLIAKGTGVMALWSQVWPLLVLSAAIMAVAVRAFRRRLD